jgi:hypothetical protein
MFDFKTAREEIIKKLKAENDKLISEEVKELKTTDIKEPRWRKVLKKYGGLESNIPIWSRYWRIRP